MAKAILLAAGNGVRLRPITETRPKPLIPVLCKPIIAWHVESLLKAGVEEIIVVVSYMREVIEEYLTKKYGNARFRFINQGEPRGTGDAVLKAVKDLGDEDVIIAYSDIYLANWRIYRTLAETNTPTIVGAEVDDPWNYGVLEMSDRFLRRIVEKPLNPSSKLINAGIYKLNVRDIVEHSDIGVSERGEIEFTDIVTKIASSKRVAVIGLERGQWLDIGRPWHVIEANKMALANMSGEIRGKVVQPVWITGNVYVDESAVIKPFTTIEGPAYIGREVHIGPNARIRPWTVICDKSVVGFSVEVKESVLFENVHAHHLSYIGDSIICENVNLGAGTITANLRFDGKTVKMLIRDRVEDTGRTKMGAVIGGGVKTGVNVSLMPGVKIGSGSWIRPGTVIYRDVPSRVIYPDLIEVPENNNK